MWLDNLLIWSDKVRFVPVVNLVTLWCFCVDGLRYPGKIGRCAKLVGTVISCLVLASIVANLFFWAPDWVKGIIILLGIYGIVLGGIFAVRGDVLTQRRLQAERRR